MSVLDKASRVRPPSSVSLVDDGTLAAAASTAAIETGVADWPENTDCWITIQVSGAHDIDFGESGMAAPGDTGVFPAGHQHQYELQKARPEDGFLRITANEALAYKIWLSSRP